MYRSLLLCLMLFASSLHVAGQGKTNETLISEIRSLNVGGQLELTFDAAGNSSRVKAVSENFAEKETDKAGIRAMNFAIGFTYAGQALIAEPDPITVSFWVMTAKPVFADNSQLTVFAGNEKLDLGPSRYAGKPRMQMEYLNYEISRQNLQRIAASLNVRLQIGRHEFTFTPKQLRLISNLLAVSAVKTNPAQ